MPAHNQDNILRSFIRNTPFILVLISCLSICLVNTAHTQCTTTMATPIPDNDVVTLGFNVSGLANSSLASPAQGICGVEISFNHEFISDLTIFLISPAGTIVQLIGPDGMIGNNTNLTTWNIQFIPCGMTANPDAGFPGVWDNQAGWNGLTTYSGDYHPYSGCLEDFNVGSANGQWLLVVQDHDQNQLGNILEATLLFCDPTGLECSECLPNGGALSPASFSRCAGQNILSSEITIDFGNNHPTASLYGYEFVLISGNTILQHGTAFSATPPAGNYMLCGLSYLLADSTAVQALLDLGDWPGIPQDILSGQICADISSNCIPLDIMAPPDTTRVTGQICQGESFIYGGQTYTTVGTFYQTHDGPGMCDSIFEIRVGARMLDVTIPPTDTLFCTDPNVSLSANVSGANGPFSYDWTTTFGNITSASNLQTISVNQAGPYTVSVTDGICTGNASIDVHAGPGFPQVLVEGGTLNCTTTSLNLTPVFIPSNGLVQWTGPNGFSSNQRDITVTEAGVYELTITNQQGCSTTREVLIGLDTITENPVLTLLDRNCAIPYAALGYIPTLLLSELEWGGPNNFTANGIIAHITDPGLYQLTVTFANGCIRHSDFLFDGDFTLPEISVPAADTLNCNETIILTATSITPGVSFYWQGPNSFSSSLPTISITQEGDYFGSVLAPNGCRNTAVVNIFGGADVFDYQILLDTINCLQDSIDIGVVTADADVFEWINYAGPDADQPVIHIGSAGIYTVQMTDTDAGCLLTASLLVIEDKQLPFFDMTRDTVSCLDPIAEFSFIPLPGFDYTNVYWVLPDLTIVPGPNLSTSMPGVHVLHGVTSNGCENIFPVELEFDTLAPFVLTESDTLLCMDTVQVLAQSLDPVVQYTWSGPGILNINDNIADVTIAGIYTVSAMGLNGCVNEYTFIVDSNHVLPVFTLINDTLRCDMTATLSILTADSIIEYQWFDPSDQLIASDSTVEVNEPGDFKVQVQGANRCIAYDTITLSPVMYPVIDISSDTLSCADTIAALESLIDISPLGIRWINILDDTIGTNTSVNVNDGGPYYLQVTGPNGCISRDTILVPYDTISPNASINVIGEVRCLERDVILDGGGSTPSGLLFDWTSFGGTITSDPTESLIDALDSGRYQLIVTRLDNGCKDTTEYHLLVSPDEIHAVTLDIIRPVCAGDENGAIEITGISGGVGTFVFQLEDGPVEDDSLFNQLSAGSYLLAVFDESGCEYDTLVEIPATTDYTVSAGGDIEIHIGETATLSGTTTLPDSAISNQAWDSLATPLCMLCPEFDVAPWQTTSYTFSVISETGCVIADEMTVFVVEKAKFYIPNIFSPNGDNINDEVRIGATPGITRVLQWIIFDRWGDAVYGKTDFDPGDPSVFWNGQTTTGEFANPGVFPYLIEIQLINGSRELLHGNITLIR